MKKCDTAGQATDDDIIWSIRFTCWITKVTGPQSEYVIFLALHDNTDYVNTSVGLSALPVLLNFL